MDYKLDFLSYQTNTTNFNVPLHKHNCYEFVYYITGSGKTTIENKQYDFKENTFAIIPPDALHSEITKEESDIIYFGFKSQSSKIRIQKGIYRDKANNKILNIVSEMKNEILIKKPNYDIKLNLLIHELLIEYDRLINPHTVEKNNSFSYIINFIHENYNQLLDVQDLAKISCLSYHRFRHLFKEKTGFSPVQYILSIRLKNAKEMLEFTNMSITNIALSCGFSNPSQFTTQFKKRYGLSPRIFRNQQKT